MTGRRRSVAADGACVFTQGERREELESERNVGECEVRDYYCSAARPCDSLERGLRSPKTEAALPLAGVQRSDGRPPQLQAVRHWAAAAPDWSSGMLAGFLRVGRLLEPILLQPQIELSAREAEALGGARPVPAALAQHLSDGRRAPSCRDRSSTAPGGLPVGFEREVLHAE